MGHYVGKLDFNSLIGTKIMEIEHDGAVEKGIFIPIAANGIVQWGDEMQLWFRAFAYRNPKARFTHFLMKFIPREAVRKLSASQLEAFANHQIGGMIRVDAKSDKEPKELNTEDFISNNI